MKFLLYHLALLLFLCICTTSKSDDPSGQFCNNNKNISSSTLSANIGDLLSEIVETTAQNGFSTASRGKGENRVYGLAQCRGDVSSKDCSSCIQDAARQIRKLCPNQADARIWYEFCFLRYDTRDFRGEVDTVGILYANVENATDPENFEKKLSALFNKIKSEAIVSSNKGLGKGTSKISDFSTLYALVQCTRDLSQLNCAQCLAIAINNFEGFCDNKKGCRVLYSSCYVRYELYPFYFPLDKQKSLENASRAYYASLVSKP